MAVNDIICISELKMSGDDVTLFKELPIFAEHGMICSIGSKTRSKDATYSQHHGTCIIHRAHLNLRVVQLGPLFDAIKGYEDVKVMLQPNDTAGQRRQGCEGRLIVCDVGQFVLVHVYSPYARDRYELRMQFEDFMLALVQQLQLRYENVVYCGDLNVITEHAINSIAGGTEFEINKFKTLQEECQLVDALTLQCSKIANNAACLETVARSTLDHFLVSQHMSNDVTCEILDTQFAGFSDHAPLRLIYNKTVKMDDTVEDV